jgi:hypothetical protein
VRKQFIPHTQEQREPFFVRAVERDRVVKAVVQPGCRSEEQRTGFAGTVAHGDDIIEMLPVKLFNGLRAMSCVERQPGVQSVEVSVRRPDDTTEVMFFENNIRAD